MGKVKSVLELARYKPGDEAWVVTFLSNGGTVKPQKKLRLADESYNKVVSLVSSKLAVSHIKIKSVIRIDGIYYYISSRGKCFPEHSLCDSAASARLVRNSVSKVIKDWVSQY